MDNTMAQIEAALDRHVRYVTNQYTSHNECDRSRESLLALIRSALAPQRVEQAEPRFENLTEREKARDKELRIAHLRGEVAALGRVIRNLKKYGGTDAMVRFIREQENVKDTLRKEHAR